MSAKKRKGLLTVCLKEARPYMPPDLEFSILAQYRQNRTNGLPNHEAGVNSLRSHLDAVRAMIKAEQGVAVPKAAEQDQAPALVAPTRDEVVAKQEREEQAKKAEADKRRSDEEQARKEEDRKRIAQASQAAADTFVLGGNAMDNLTGQKDIFGAMEDAAPVAEAKADKAKAQADLDDALAELGDIFGKNFRINMMPEQQSKLVPVLVKLFDAAFRLGYYKFKDAAKFALDKIRAALGDEVADAITLEHLQGAYIAMSGGKSEADNIVAVSSVGAKSVIERHTARAANQEKLNVPSTNAGMERNSTRSAIEPAVGNAIQDDARNATAGTGKDGGQTSGSDGGGRQDGVSVSPSSSIADRERSDQLIRGGREPDGPASSDARTDFGERSGDSGITGVPPDAIPAEQVKNAATDGTEDAKKRSEQRAASKLEIKPGDLQNVRDTLPYLLPAQQEDVHKAETIFAKPTGYGMLFTNGTGTGKTFTGLGVVKRFALQGKTNTLIVVPDNKIGSDWIKSGKALGLDIAQLDDTTQAGNGIVLTTYANLGANDALAKRQWDLVIPDESHSLMQSADGVATGYLQNLRAITHHPDGLVQRFTMQNRADIDRYAELDREIAANNKIINNDDTMDVMRQSLQAANEKLKDKQNLLRIKLNKAREAVDKEVAAMQGEKRTRLVFLSATPFAYEKTVDWANGYLFDYMDGYPYDPQRAGLNYNQPDPFQYFMMTRFGYTMRVNKLTGPGPKVDSGLLQRQFNAELKKKGVLSGRMLDVKPDYDRRFVLVDSAIGNKIDEALDWLQEKSKAEAEAQAKEKDRTKQVSGMVSLHDIVRDQFDYLSRRYLLEAVKAEAVIPIVKQHLALGRKVVVFHDYNKGGSSNPFDIQTRTASAEADEQAVANVQAFNKAVREFRSAFPELVTGLNNLLSPIEVFKKQLPQTMLINGKEKERDLLARYLSFQDDANGPQVMLVQSDKNKGWSGHDTTGKHQRVLINLGQPTAPTKAIQQEGRIYRTGQASNAIMRYLNTGTSWERWAFATTIAQRSSTAENLGMGEQARALKDSFIAAFEESDTFAPGHEGEGTGGKARDKASNDAITEYDRAKSFYYGTQKKNAKTKAQEGVDYFATPEPVGLKMVEWLDARSGEDLLEPSGGHGAIARWMPEKAQKTVIEPSANLRSRMALVLDLESTKIIPGTFEELNVVNKFDGIAMNPPFGVGGKTAIDHLAKAATHLRDGGRIVALIPTGPAADKRFDNWFYETTEKPIKPVATHPTLGDIFKGDTLSIDGYKSIEWIVNSAQNGFVQIKTKSGGGTSEPLNGRIMAIKPTGKRTESFKAAEGLYLVANINLPQITFERAGTAVATRIVVLEKHAKESDAPKQTAARIDLTSIDNIEDLFNRLENVNLSKRSKPETAEAENVPPKEQIKLISPQKLDKPTTSVGAEVQILGKSYKVTTYTTNAGKELRGVWVPTKAIALQFGASTFEKRGLGFFLRERDFPKSGNAEAGAAFARDRLAEAPTPSANRLQMSVSDVQKAIDEMAAKWTNGPKISVVKMPSDLPRPAPSDARGLLYGDTAYIVASNHTNRAGVQRTLAHEAIGHYGLWKMLGTDGTRKFQKNLQLALKSGNKPLNELSQKVRKLYVDNNGKFNLSPEDEANEIAAFAVEAALDADGNFKPGFGFMKEVYAKIAQFLRDLGINIKFTNLELQGMLVAATRGMEAGKRLDGGGQAVVASAARNAGVDAMASEGDSIYARGKFKGWPKSSNWTRQEYNDVVSLLPANYRNDPHRREPLSAKDWDLLTAAALPDLQKINEGLKQGQGFGIDELGNIEADARNVDLNQIKGAIEVAEKHGLGIYVKGVMSRHAKELQNAGFVSEFGLGGVLMREAKTTQNPIPDPNSAFGRKDIGSVMSYRPRGFSHLMFSRGADPFYSALTKGIENVKANAAPGLGWLDAIKGLVNKGTVKADEVEWSGVTDWLKMQTGKVMKADVVAFLDANGVKVEETVLGKKIVNDEFVDMFDNTMPNRLVEISETKYGQYQLPGGTNYREVLLTLPDKMRPVTLEEVNTARSKVSALLPPLTRTEYDTLLASGNAQMVKGDPAKQDYKSSHWDQKNVLAHIRVNDRIDSEGRKVLFVEELQSDMGQEGKKKGFTKPVLSASQRTAKLDEAKVLAKAIRARSDADRAKGLEQISDETLELNKADSLKTSDIMRELEADKAQALSNTGRIPNAPFVGKTDAWVSLALKRVIKMAVDGGYDRVAFVNGEQSADRYSLSKSVDKISWRGNGMTGRTVNIQLSESGTATLLVNESGIVVGSRGAGNVLSDAEGKSLDVVIGKDVAAAVMADQEGELAGEGLNIGGEGMKTFYDQIVPNIAKDVIRKLGGGQLENVSINRNDKPEIEGLVDFKIFKRNGAFDLQRTNSPGIVGTFKTSDEAIAEGQRLQSLEQKTQTGFSITPAMKERAADGLPLFAKQSTGGMTVDQARAITDPLTAKWNLDVKVVATPEDLPVPAPSDVRGMYMNGKIWIVASNNANRAQILETLGHEAIAHHGLREMLGREDWRKLMTNINLAIKSGNKPLNAISQRVRSEYVDDNGKFNLNSNQEADEIAAKVVEGAIDPATGEFNPGFGFMKSVFAKVAQFLRDLGIDVKFTNLELQGMLVASMRNMESGARMQGGGAQVVAASRSPMKSIDANVRRGMESLAKALDEKTTVHRAMFRNGLGWVDFVWGDEGAIRANGKTKGGMGLSHILEARQRKDGMSEPEALELLNNIVEAIASGADVRRDSFGQSTTVTVEKNGVQAILTKKVGSNAWLLSGWQTKNPGASGAGSVAATATAPRPTTAQSGSVSGFTEIVSQNLGDGNTSLGRTGDLLTSYTPEEAKKKQLEEEAARKAEAEKPKAPTGRKVTADQVDLFNEQGALFARGGDQSIGDAIQAITVTNIKTKAGNKLADYRNLGLQFLGGRQINDLYAKDLPQLPDYTRMVQQMSADANEVGANADAVATSWGKLKDERQLAELMHDATLAQIDPAKNYVIGDSYLQWEKLKNQYEKLSKEAKKVYADARDSYEEHYAQIREAIRDKIERSDMAKPAKTEMLKRMDGEFFEKIKGVYFPLARFGKYVVVTRKGVNVVSVSRAETLNEAEALRASMRKQFPADRGYSVGKVTKDKEFNAARDSVGRGFLKDLFDVLDNEGIGDQLQDAVNQLYLASMPDLSWAKHGIHRKGTPGFSQDARRAYAQNMFHGARYLAKLRYADQLQAKLTDMQDHVDAQIDNEEFDSVKAQQVVDELTKRNDSLMNPKSNPLSTALTSFGFVFHLGLSPASAMVNLSQTALVAYPIMGAKWGFDKAAAALTVAAAQTTANKNNISSALNPDERRAYDAAVAAGTIDVTNAHDLAGIAQGEDQGVMWKTRPVMKWASFMFHHAERFNRQVTFVASYRLARAAGTTHEAAFEQATKATYDGHFDYAASNRPRIMQGNAAKVILLFKQFAQNMIYTLARQVQLSVKAETPAGKKEARKALGGILVLHALAAGILGLPAVLVEIPLTVASMLGSDDDEPWDAETALRNMLADTFGQKPAEVMARGLSRLTPFDISGRVSLNHLIFPDIQEGLEGQRLAESAMTAALGPVAGIGVNIFKGMQEISEGRIARGLESMMPVALRNPMKAYRYNTEGNIDKTGVVINEKVSTAGVWGQAFGFSPSEVRNAQEARSAIYQADSALNRRRSALMNQFAMASMAGDEDGKKEVRQDIDAFNAKNPNRKITPIQLIKSVRSRKQRIKDAENGVYLPKKRRDAMDAGRFGAEDNAAKP